MPNQAEILTIFSLVFLGLVVMTLMQLIAAAVTNKAFKFRMSGASIIASMALAWPTSMMLLVFLAYIGIMPTVPDNKWIVACFMLISMGSYVGWLWCFQPDSIEQLSLRKLKKLELDKNKILLDYTLDKWKEMKKEKNGDIDAVEVEIVKIREERVFILNKYRRFKPVTEWFKKAPAVNSDPT